MDVQRSAAGRRNAVRRTGLGRAKVYLPSCLCHSGMMGRPEKLFQRLSRTCLYTLRAASGHNMAGVRQQN